MFRISVQFNNVLDHPTRGQFLQKIFRTGRDRDSVSGRTADQEECTKETTQRVIVSSACPSPEKACLQMLCMRASHVRLSISLRARCVTEGQCNLGQRLPCYGALLIY